MTEYTITAREVVNRSPSEVIRWLATPGLMTRWVLGAVKVEALDGRGIAAGARTRLVVQVGRYGHAYLGEIIDVTESRLVRRYHLERMKTGVLAAPAGQEEYERVLTYEFSPGAAASGTWLSCVAQTSIPGLPKTAARTGAKSEAKSLARSLERMRVCAEGGSAGADGGLFARSFSPQAL